MVWLAGRQQEGKPYGCFLWVGVVLRVCFLIVINHLRAAICLQATAAGMTRAGVASRVLIAR